MQELLLEAVSHGCSVAHLRAIHLYPVFTHSGKTPDLSLIGQELLRRAAAMLLLAGAAQALQPTLPPPRTKTALRAFTNPFAQRPEEMKELEPYETTPLFGECRRKLAACIIVGFEDFGGVATNAQAEVEVAAADVRLKSLKGGAPRVSEIALAASSRSCPSAPSACFSAQI